jgi:hypothetical protein
MVDPKDDDRPTSTTTTSTNSTTSSTTSSSSFDRLVAIADKKEEWYFLSRRTKIDLLLQIQTIITKGVSYEEYKDTSRLGTTMKGYTVVRGPNHDNGNEDYHDDDDGEVEFENEAEVLGYMLMMKKNVSDILFCLQVQEGMIPKPKMLTKGHYQTRRVVVEGGEGRNNENHNDENENETTSRPQVILQTFPSISQDRSGLLSHCKGELWLDPNYVQSDDDIETFVPDVHNTNNNTNTHHSGGVMIVLSAGNQPTLGVIDVLYGLFLQNHVVYMKQHPIRNYMNPLLHKIFQPLMERGYMDIEAHTTNDRSAALVYHPVVSAVHLTGGKGTHDTIVWGIGLPHSTEQEQNRKNNTPKLQATMSSELGAVSPWIIIPSSYTEKAMVAQMKMCANWIYNNASCNCNAPKCIVIADDWDQRDDFCSLLEHYLSRHRLPVPYYPGTEQRWNDFVQHYEGSTAPDEKKKDDDDNAAAVTNMKRLESTSGLGITERRLVAPLLSNQPVLLPYLVLSIDVDLNTEEGRTAAKKEYAFQTEPFAPVYTIATLKGTSQRDVRTFTKTATTFCNGYLYGTLSGTITVPPSMVNDVSVQQLIGNLKYGCLGVNVWGGMGYITQCCGRWGAYPGETLDSVSSGIGFVGNAIGIPHATKYVMTSPIEHFTHPSLKRNLKLEQNIVQALIKFILDRTAFNLIKIVSTSLGVDLRKVAGMSISVIVAVVAAMVVRRNSS